MRWFCVILALGLPLAACVVEDKLPGPVGPGDTTDGDTGGGGGDTGTGTGTGSGSGSGSDTPVGLNVLLTVVDRDGNAVPEFDERDDVYFSIKIVDAAKPVVAEDYAFQVIASSGELLSGDPFSCRLFHVNVRGMIDDPGKSPTGDNVQAAGGGDCAHDQQRSADGRILVRAMPYDMPETSGKSNAKLTLKACNLATCPADAPFVTELVAPFEIDR
jgi:hypothetical protein